MFRRLNVHPVALALFVSSPVAAFCLLVAWNEGAGSVDWSGALLPLSIGLATPVTAVLVASLLLRRPSLTGDQRPIALWIGASALAVLIGDLVSAAIFVTLKELGQSPAYRDGVGQILAYTVALVVFGLVIYGLPMLLVVLADGGAWMALVRRWRRSPGRSPALD